MFAEFDVDMDMDIDKDDSALQKATEAHPASNLIEKAAEANKDMSVTPNGTSEDAEHTTDSVTPDFSDDKITTTNASHTGKLPHNVSQVDLLLKQKSLCSIDSVYNLQLFD